MFWNRIFSRNDWGQPVYKTLGGLHERLARHNEVERGFESVHTKLNLILDHLNLEYVPETDKREPAKLVEKKNVWDKAMTDLCFAISGAGCTPATELKKKKRGRPKKK